MTPLRRRRATGRAVRAGLTADVDAALYARGTIEAPSRFFDPVALGGLIVSVATLAWQIYSDRKKQSQKPTQEVLARVVRMTRPEQSGFTGC